MGIAECSGKDVISCTAPVKAQLSVCSACLTHPMPPPQVIETSFKDSLYLNLQLSTPAACSNEKQNKKESREIKRNRQSAL